MTVDRCAVAVFLVLAVLNLWVELPDPSGKLVVKRHEWESF